MAMGKRRSRFFPLAVALWLGLAAAPAQATMASCEEVRLDWAAFLAVAERYLEPAALPAWRALSVRKAPATCGPPPPEPWRVMHTGRFLERLARDVASLVRRAGPNRAREFLADLNDSSALVGYQQSIRRDGGWIGCTRVELALVAQGPSRFLELTHRPQASEFCPQQPPAPDHVPRLRYPLPTP